MANIQQSETKKVHLDQGNITALEHQNTYIAPLPTPTNMAAYEQVKEGFAERMMRMAEKEQEHRFKTTLQKVELDAYIAQAEYSFRKRGQWFALGGVAIISSLSTYSLYLGHPTTAASIAGTVIVALAGVFIYQSRKSKPSEKPDSQVSTETEPTQQAIDPAQNPS